MRDCTVKKICQNCQEDLSEQYLLFEPVFAGDFQILPDSTFSLSKYFQELTVLWTVHFRELLQFPGIIIFFVSTAYKPSLHLWFWPPGGFCAESQASFLLRGLPLSPAGSLLPGIQLVRGVLLSVYRKTLHSLNGPGERKAVGWVQGSFEGWYAIRSQLWFQSSPP